MNSTDFMKRMTVPLTLVAWALRWGYGMYHAQPFLPGGDCESYVHAADHILQTGNLLSDRPMVYPLFLALFYVWPGRRLWLVLLVQSFIGALCVPLVQRLGHGLQVDTAGGYAAWWVAFDPFLIYFSRFFLSETLFTFLVLAGLFCFVQFQAQPSKGMASVAGACFSLAALCRSIFLPLVALILMVAIIKILQKKGPARGAAGVFVLTCAVFLGSWSAYVFRQTGTFQIAAPQKGLSTYEGLNPDFNHANSITQWQEAMGREAKAQGLTMDTPKRDAYFWHKSTVWIHDHPGSFIRLMARKFLKFWRIIPYQDYYSRTQVLISALYFGPLLVLAIIGSGFVLRKGTLETSGMGFILLFIMTYALINTITWTQIRYRVPLHPLLALLAGVGLERLSRGIKGHLAGASPRL